MKYQSIYIKRSRGKREEQMSEFFMRFNNTTGSIVTVSGLDALLSSYTGMPTLETAVVERGKVVNDVKGTGNSINSFSVANGESCVFKITWKGGLFNLKGGSENSYKDIVISGGYKLVGDYDIPNDFMRLLFSDCKKYTQLIEDEFDASELYPVSVGVGFLDYTWYNCNSLVNAAVPNTANWGVTSINNAFMRGTWSGCSSLVTAVVPDTSNWNVTKVSSNFFLANAWYGCRSLTTAVVPDTSNWKVTSLAGNFLAYTWYNCSSLTTAVVPDTSNWKVTSIGNDFLGYTWFACSSLTTVVLPDTSNWNVTYIITNFIRNTFYTNSLSDDGATIILKGDLYTGLMSQFTTNSMGLPDSKVINIKVDRDLIPAYQGSSSWTNIIPSKFISW